MPNHYRRPTFSNEGEPAFSFLSHTSLWIGVALILLSRLLLLYFSQWQAGDDGARYMQEGINLALYSVFSSSHAVPPPPTAHDLPLYPLLLALLYKITADVALCGLLASLLNTLFYSLAIVGVYGIAMLLSKQHSVAIIALLVMGIIPDGIPYSIFYMPDSLFIALFVGANFFLILYVRGSSLFSIVFSALLLGLSILSKPISLFYITVYGIILVIYPIKKPLLSKIYVLLLVIIIAAVTLSPWIIRNYLSFGYPHLSTVIGSNLHHVNLKRMRQDMGHRNPAPTQPRQQKKQEKNPFKISHQQEKEALAEISSNIPAYLYTLAKRHPRLYLGTGTIATLRLLGYNDAAKQLATAAAKPSIQHIKATPIAAIVLQLSSWVVLLAIYLCSVLGLWCIVAKKQWFTVLLLGLGFLYFAAIIGPLTSTRYRFVMIPFFALFSGYGVHYFVLLLREKIAKKRSLYPLEGKH